MACLEHLKPKSREEFADAVWLEDPCKYAYVREDRFVCCNPRYMPKMNSCLLKVDDIDKSVPSKLVGYTKPKPIGNHLFEGRYWWLKGYDLGMPYQDFVYGNKGRWKDGKQHGVTVVPSEAVTFKVVK